MGPGGIRNSLVVLSTRASYLLAKDPSRYMSKESRSTAFWLIGVRADRDTATSCRMTRKAQGGVQGTLKDGKFLTNPKLHRWLRDA